MKIDIRKVLLNLPIVSGIISAIYITYLGIINPGALLIYVPDDGLFDIIIAKNVVAGHFFSFDQVTFTNGFHPLWVLIISPLLALSNSLIPPLILGIGFMVAGELIFIRLINYLYSEKLAILCAIGLSLSVGLFLLSVTALETSLLIFFISLTMYYFFTRIQKGTINFYILGVLSALLFLSRTDSIFLIIILLSVYIIFYDRTRSMGKIQNLFKWLVSLVACVSPWIIFNYLKTGSIFQDTTTAIPNLVTRELFIGYQANFLTYLNVVLLEGARLPFYVAKLSGFPCILVAILLISTLYLMLKTKTDDKKIFFLVYLTYFICIILSNASRLSTREWYSGPFIGLIIFCLGYLLLESNKLYLKERFSEKQIGSVFCTIIVVILLGNSSLVLNGPFPMQKDAANTVSSSLVCLQQHNIPNSTLIGFSDWAGIYGYYGNLRTTTLDGLANHDVFLKIQQGRVIEYLQDSNIHYFTIRSVLQQDWYLGPGSGLYYTEGPCGFFKLLTSNDEIYSTYFKENINATDSNVNRYLSSGWILPNYSVDREDDFIEEKFIPLNIDKSKLNGEAWSSNYSSDIYLPLKENNNYTVILTMHPIQPVTSTDNILVIVDDHIEDPIIMNTSNNQNYSIPVYAEKNVTHIQLKFPNSSLIKDNQNGRTLFYYVALSNIRITMNDH